MSNPKQNFIYNSLYQLLALAVPLITMPYLARMLGPKGLGEYSYAFAIATYFVLFIQLGIKNYGTREIAKCRHQQQRISRLFWELAILQAICLAIVGSAYVWYTYVISLNKLISGVLCLYVLSGGLDVTWFFSGLENFKIIVARSTLIKILTTACIFLFVKKAEDVYIYVSIIAGGELLAQLFLWPFLRHYIIPVHISIGRLVRHVKPMLILFIPIVAVSIYKIMDKIMLGKMSNITEVGFYDSSEKIIQIPLILIVSLGTVMLPHMSNLYATQKTGRATVIFEKSVFFAMFLSTTMGFGIMAIAKTFVPWFYGSDFTPCITLFYILLPSCMFMAFANVIRTQYLIPNSKDKEFVVSIIAGAVVNVLLNWVLIPPLGAVGASIGTLGAEIVVCVWQTVYVYREMPVLRCAWRALPFVGAGLGMFWIIRPLQFVSLPAIINLLFQSVLGIVIYVILLGGAYMVCVRPSWAQCRTMAGGWFEKIHRFK